MMLNTRCANLAATIFVGRAILESVVAHFDADGNRLEPAVKGRFPGFVFQDSTHATLP